MAGKTEAKRPVSKVATKTAPSAGGKSAAAKAPAVKGKPLPVNDKSAKTSALKAPASKTAAAKAPAKMPVAKAVAAPAKAAPAAAKPIPAKPVAPSGPKPKRQLNGATRVGIAGCAGRMGQMLLKMLSQAPGVLVVGGTERRGSPALGMDLGALAGAEPFGITVGDDPALLFDSADVVIDFTNPSATALHAGYAAKNGTAHVIGTTGLDTDQQAAVARAAQRAPIVMAANMSLGVNLLEMVVEQMARILDTDWDIEVVEMHHRHKIDAPSGTALALGEAAARGRGTTLRRVAKRGRDGQAGPRAKGEIGFAALRGGDVVGDHTVIFAADGERVEVTHKASSRELFARGAVKAVLWAAGKGPGLYTMKDVLGFSVGGGTSNGA